MLSRLRNMFRVPDLRNKIIFTIVIIAVYRVGAHLPVPYVDFSAIKDLQHSAKNSGVVGFLDLFSGGAITNVAIFFLGIMPYITASIIMQLLGVVIPKLEQWQNEGQVGQKKITQWTRYLTVALALVQSTGFVFALHQGKSGLLGFAGFTSGRDLIPHFDAPRAALIVLVWTAGTALVMWLGELITQRGIGNGMSIIIFASVVSRLPAQGSAIYSQGSKIKFFVIIAIGIAMIVGIVFVESGQRRIPVQFAKRVVGRRMYGGQSTYIPLKVNQSGVIPVIFASSILSFPALIASVMGDNFNGVQKWINDNLVTRTSWWYILFYTILIIFFAYFYTAIAFNPQQQADIIRKQGGFIPGIRPGPPTERYLAKVLNRITLPGSLFLATIAVIPLLVFALWNISQFPFGGTALLITVGVALETMKQIDSQLMMRNYEGFLA
jgi:preprotein translocase subunit SecY